MERQEIVRLILLLSPILLIQLAVVVYALIDLSKRERTRGSRLAWAVGLVLTSLAIPGGLIVAGIYMAWGRHAEA